MMNNRGREIGVDIGREVVDELRGLCWNWLYEPHSCLFISLSTSRLLGQLGSRILVALLCALVLLCIAFCMYIGTRAHRA